MSTKINIRRSKNTWEKNEESAFFYNDCWLTFIFFWVYATFHRDRFYCYLVRFGVALSLKNQWAFIWIVFCFSFSKFILTEQNLKLYHDIVHLNILNNSKCWKLTYEA